MVLAANADDVKELAGLEGAIPQLANIANKAAKPPHMNKSALKAALGALAVCMPRSRHALDSQTTDPHLSPTT